MTAAVLASVPLLAAPARADEGSPAVLEYDDAPPIERASWTAQAEQLQPQQAHKFQREHEFQQAYQIRRPRQVEHTEHARQIRRIHLVRRTRQVRWAHRVRQVRRIRRMYRTRSLSLVRRNKLIGLGLLGRFGWGGARQWRCLDLLWSRESGWNHRSRNPGSGASGIPQALPGSKMARVGADWRTNPQTQIRWGLRYIRGRYGSPCGAWAHFGAAGWY